MTKFSDEVVLHSQQRHPNIVQLMGVYYPPRSQLPMLIMEYLPFSLTQCLEKEELPLHQMKYSILLDVAKGVCYLHGKSPPIVHRDLTANNVLLTLSYTAKISDLGVSRLADTFKKQHLTAAPGNAMVMPPEALEDNPVYDYKLDVFSYGCLILHVLTGQFPEPTNQFIPGKGESYRKVPEWDRRLKYTQQIPEENELLPLAKQCLNDDPTGRLEMIDCHQFVEQVLSKYPRMKNTVELIKEKEATERELTAQIQAEKITRENILQNTKKFEQIIEVLKVEKEEVAEKAKSVSKRLTSQVTDLSSLLSLRKKEFNNYSEALKETVRSRDKQLVKTQQDNMTILKKREDELREEHSVALSKMKEDYEAKITEMKEEYEEKLSTTMKKFEQKLSKTHEDCEVRVADVIKQFTVKSSKALENVTKSKNETISFLLSHTSVIIPPYQTQKELIQPLLTQRLKKGDKW